MISFGISGFIAVTQTVFLVELASHWELFPVFFRDARADRVLEFTAIGDTVNLASPIEGLGVRDRMVDASVLEEFPAQNVRGIEQPISVFAPRDPRNASVQSAAANDKSL